MKENEFDFLKGNKGNNGEITPFFIRKIELTNEVTENEKFLANSYDEDKKRAPLDKNPLLGGAYGIITTLPDLTKFLKFQLENKNPLIKESTQFLFKDEENNTGYFWDLGIGKKEGFYYGKTGTSNGVQSGILICPDSDYGLVLIMNNKSDAALNDWTSLYNRIETNLIVYPKINLVSLLQKEFINNPEKTFEKYKKLKNDSINYVSGSNYLNEFGYELISGNQTEKAIKIFELAISEDPKNANLYDSLGEAFFSIKNYKKSLINYEKSLELNPNNTNAEKFINKIKYLTQK